MSRLRIEAFRTACELIAFAEGSEDPADDLIAVGVGLVHIGRELRGKDPAHQRALIMAARELAEDRDEQTAALLASDASPGASRSRVRSRGRR